MAGPKTERALATDVTTMVDLVLVARAYGLSGTVPVGAEAAGKLMHPAIALDIPDELHKLNKSSHPFTHKGQEPTADEAWTFMSTLLPSGWQLEKPELAIHRVTHDGWYPSAGYAWGFLIIDGHGDVYKRTPRVGGLTLLVDFIAVLQPHL